MSRSPFATSARLVIDQAVLAKVRAGRLRSDDWPYGLRAVVQVAIGLFALTTLLALFAGPIRGRSELTVPNSLTSSVPDALVWVLVFLLAFCLAVLTTAAIHGPWWLSVLGLLSVGLLLTIWSVAGASTRGLVPSIAIPAGALLVILVLLVVRRRRGLAWWEFPLLLGLIGVVLGLCLLNFASSDRFLGFRFAPTFVDQTLSLLTYLVLPAAFAAGAAVAEIAVGLTMVATRTAQRQTSGRWPYALLATVLVIRLAQEGRRLSDFDPVNSGWIAVLPAIGLVAAFAGLGWLISRLTPLRDIPVASLPDDLGRISIFVGAGVIAMILPVSVFLLGFQVVVSVNPALASGFDPSPLVDRLVDGFRVALGALLVVLALRQAHRGRGGLALVLGGSGLMLLALGIRLLTGYRWAFWLDPDALVTVVTVLVVALGAWLLARRALTRDRAVALAALLALAVLLSVRSVIVDPFGVLLGYGGVAFVLFGVTWDFLTSSDWANTDGPRVRRPVRVLLAVGYPLLTVTIVASEALIRRPRATSDVNGFAELGELVLGTALLAAVVVVVVSTIRSNRELV